MEIPLSRVPEQFFDRELWDIFVSYFDNPRTAYETIGFPPGPSGYHRDDDPSKITKARWREIDEAANVAVAILLCLQQKFVAGELVANGIPFGLWRASHQPIPPAYWLRLWPNFSENSAVRTQERFDDIRVTWTPKNGKAEFQERLEDFLKEQKKNGQEARKALIQAAKDYFGRHIPLRDFNKAYSSVFKKARGRPRREKK